MFRNLSFKIIMASILFLTSFPVSSFAQKGGIPQEQTELTGTRKQLATIIFSGLAGAILGLSTLSFYGRPQEKLNNIAIGAALGIFTGAAYTTYRAAKAPYDVYQGTEFKFLDESSLREMQLASNVPAASLNWSWDF
jgi:hypothetical protein